MALTNHRIPWQETYSNYTNPTVQSGCASIWKRCSAYRRVMMILIKRRI